MIIVRLAEGAWQHAGARFSEWNGAALLVGWGYALHSQLDVFGISQSFDVLAQWADQAAWANILLAAGTVRVAALFINGYFEGMRRHTPTMRFIASWIAFMVWAAVSLGLFYAWRDLGGSPTGWIVYGYVAINELRNINQTRKDMLAVRRSVHALARKQ